MRAMIAMSGGVDSSVAVRRMLDAGYDCAGCTMRLFDNTDAGLDRKGTCCALDDVDDARTVAYRMGIPHYVFNFSEDFREKVIADFTSCYTCGCTPNPCIECNRHLKFGRLLERALLLNYDCLATGHYARIEERDGRYLLCRAADTQRDQSYVLYMLTQQQLAHLRFPLGGLTKAQVRTIAAENGFGNAQKPDSQDICFVPDGDYAAAIERLTGKPSAPGDFIDRSGNVLGQHQGIIRYTLGQHRGLGLHWHEPLYVLRIDPAANTVTLGPQEALFSSELTAQPFNWISGEVPAQPVRCTAKTRYRQTAVPATAEALDAQTVRVRFDTPQRAITPGQSAVLYHGDEVLGGGVIVAT
ncbi:MAG: tRNA 2-thiouridine(34) synthase MnmA [Oscillospiraceae bacterium]|nr:tRNA 2-thiouridine(34) synthase MnmA [Oscillospiraceae bacterium]